jgi:hypothetical protein
VRQAAIGSRPEMAFLPWTLSVFAGSTLAPRLVVRIGLRATLTAGMLISSAGLAYFTGVKPGGSYLSQVLPGAIPAGLGMGLALMSGTVAAVQGVPQELSGLASGLLNRRRPAPTLAVLERSAGDEEPEALAA